MYSEISLILPPFVVVQYFFLFLCLLLLPVYSPIVQLILITKEVDTVPFIHC